MNDQKYQLYGVGRDIYKNRPLNFVIFLNHKVLNVPEFRELH